jgi:mycothiol system anti-sigma-R factor
MPPACPDLAPFLPAYVDGELDAPERGELALHLEGCPECRRAAHLQESLKAVVRRSAPAVAPVELRQAVRLRLRDVELPGSRWDAVLRNPRAVGAVAAAIGAAVWFLGGGLDHPIFQRHSPLDDAAALHGRNLPLDYAANDVGSVQQWLQGRLDFAARVPRFSQGTALQGVRLSQLHDHPAVVIAYQVPQADGRRISLVIVDDPERSDPPGTVRRVANRQVWLSSSRGYNVVSWRSDEIVYQLVSDLDERDVLQLVQAAELR